MTIKSTTQSATDSIRNLANSIPEIPKNSTLSELTDIKSSIQKKMDTSAEVISGAVSPITDQVNGMVKSVNDQISQIAPMLALAPIGGLSLQTMGAFATNVTAALNAILGGVAIPKIESIGTQISQLTQLSTELSNLTSAIGELQSKLPTGIGFTAPSVPSVPKLPSIPKLPTL